MSNIRYYTMFFWSVILLVCLFSIVAQTSTTISWDVASFLHAAEKLLAGGSYTDNFFETNPPLIIYLSILPVLFARWIGISVLLSSYIYTYLLAILSLLISYALLEQLFAQRDSLQKNGFFIALCVVTLVLPFHDFGQREHILFLFTLPYLFRAACYAKGIRVQAWLVCLIGIFAGIGFSLKPFFFITPALIEGYLMCQQRRFFTWVRADVLIILAVFAIYAGVAWMLHPDYFSILIPYMSRLYYISSGHGWYRIMTYPVFFTCYTATIFCLIHWKQMTNPFTALLFVTLVSFMIEYCIGQTTWYYHIYPAFALSALISIFLFFDLLLQKDFSLTEYLSLLFLGMSAYILIYAQASAIKLFIILCHTKLFFMYSAFVLFITLYSALKRFTLASVCVLVTTLTSYIIYCMVFVDEWHQYTLPITFIMMIAFFILSLSFNKSNVNKWQLLFTVLLGFVVLFYPFYWSIAAYDKAVTIKLADDYIANQISPLVKNKSVYYFTTSSSWVYPLNYKLNITPVSRFASLWMIPGLIKQSIMPLNEIQKNQLQQDKLFLINMVAEDLAIKKPSIVLVDMSEHKYGLDTFKLDYITFFSASPIFQQAWRHYHYVKTIKLEQGQAQKLQVYVRRS